MIRPVRIFPFIMLIIFSILIILTEAETWAGQEDYAGKRENMVVNQLIRRGVKDAKTLEAMKNVPRHEFVRTDDLKRAYNDRPLPIGYGQTISQPYIVAYMTEILNIQGGEKVLEIGTGSGYQAAILAYVGASVYSVEIIPELYMQAKERVKKLGLSNIRLLASDGYYGWAENGPYDRIIVTAAAGHIPLPLVNQLKPGGKMIIPVGQAWAVQSLVLVEKKADGRVTTRNLLAVRFVPLVRPK